MTGTVDGDEVVAERDAAAVLDAIDDDHGISILTALAVSDDPLSAGELVDRCEVAESTVYRKLRRLRRVGLVEEHQRLGSDGRCTSTHALRAARVTVAFDDGDLTARLGREGE